MIEIKLDKQSLRKLDKAMKKLPASVYNRCVRSAAQRSARPLIKTARSLVPRKTGLLRRSIGAKTKLYRRTWAIFTSVGPRTKFRGSDKTKAQPWRYAHLIEFGTKKHKIMPKNKKALATDTGEIFAKVEVSGVKPKPFLRPAFDSQKQAVINEFKRIVFEKLDSAVRTAKK